jgi:muramoyltetrapeptide carboxypeptidase
VRVGVPGKALVPSVVQRGDVVRLVSPASWPETNWVQESIATLESWGLRADVAPHALDRHGFCAGRDEDRLADLNGAFADPEVRCIVSTRGGAGAYRIADALDFDLVRADPKPLVGFSDITHLHLALWQHCRLGAIHGTLAGPTAQASVRQLLMSTEPLTVHRHDAAVSAAVTVPGKATGPLVGGNLTAVATSVGAALSGLDGAILFLEDLMHKGLGFVDRLLTQLLRSGSLAGIAGIALGSFEGFRDVVDRGWTIVDVLEDRLGNLGVPIVGGIFAGHDLVGPHGCPDQVALPLGASANLDADAGTISFAIDHDAP